MNFNTVLPYSATTPDPRAAPADVPEALVFIVPEGIPPQNDFPAVGLAVTLEGTAADTASFELYALDEAFTPYGQVGPTVAAADRRFYRLVAATAVVVGQVVLFSPVFRGKCYLRCTVAPGAPVTVKIAPSPRS